MFAKMIRFTKDGEDERRATLVEYGLIAALVTVAAIGVLAAMGIGS